MLFRSIAASGTLDYSVVSSVSNGPTKANEFTVDTTGTLAPAVQNETKVFLSQANTSISAFLVSANTVASTTTNSAFLSGAGGVAAWGSPTNEGIVSDQLFGIGDPPYGTDAAPGTALTFYTENVNGSSALGTWDLNGASATFVGANAGTGPSPVPLPTPLLLLLSGLGLMGVVARRGKPSADLASGAVAV